MKKLLLLLALLLAAASPSLAYDFMVDGLCYNKNSDGTSVSVTYEKWNTSDNYSNLSGAVEIPESVTYNGVTYSVTSVGYSAFRKCRGLTSVSIPNSVTEIGDFAFYDCSGLTSVTIPNSVTSIGYTAFSGCRGLTSVTIGNSVTIIGSYAFYDSGLTSVTIPTSVTTIGEYAFYRTAWYDNQSDGLVYAGLVAYHYKGEMPAGTSITIKEGTKGIADECFQGCSNLTSVTIPNSVTSIGTGAFDDCIYLTEVNISDLAAWCNIHFDNWWANPLAYADHIYLNGKEIKDLVIPNSVTSIGAHAFSNFSGLTSVTIPGSVASIGTEAFSGCDNLLYAKFEGDELPSGAYNFPDEAALFVKTLELAKSDERLSYKVAFNRSEDSGDDGTSFVIPVHVLHESGEYVNLTSVKCDGKEYKAEGASSITLTHLFPSTSYPITLKWIRSGSTEQADNEIRTGSEVMMAMRTANVTPTAFVYEIDKDMDYLGEPYLLFKGENIGRKGVITGLIPRDSYSYVKRISYVDEYGQDRYYNCGTVEFTTPAVSFSEQKANMIKDTKVMLVTATNLADVETNCGFEWRRYDAPAEMPSTQVPCPVFGGNMAGVLEGLSKDVYYKFRPYVKYSNGDASYGEWVAFITADAGVKFSPMVYTYDDARSDDAGVMLSGVVIEGSDPVAEQGFEYWENYGAPATAKAERGDHLRIAASGERMSATISNNELVNGATYSYRSYAIVGGEEFYGDIKTFVADHGGIDGVEGISIDSRNADDPDALVNVYNISGQVVRAGVKRGEAVNGLQPGFYIVGGRKVLVK